MFLEKTIWLLDLFAVDKITVVKLCQKYSVVVIYFCFMRFCTVSSGDKNQASLKSSGSQQNLAHSSLSNSLSSALAYDDKTEPMSKSGKRFNYASSGRQYQVFYSVVLCVALFIDRFLLFIFCSVLQVCDLFVAFLFNISCTVNRNIVNELLKSV